MNSASPPRLFVRLFQWYCEEWMQETILGDLLEQFDEDIQRYSTWKAKQRFAWNVIRFIRPEVIKKRKGSQKLNNIAMFRNYFKVSVRNTLRHKVFSMINIGGLGVGLACCFLISIYIKHELSFDKYHENYDRIYRVLQSYRSNADAEKDPTPSLDEYQVWGNAPVGPAMDNDFPEVDQVCRFQGPRSFLFEVNGKRVQEESIWLVDSTIFDIFSWDLIAGDPSTALTEPNTIVLTRSLAKKYFGDINPMGQVIVLDTDEKMKVTGIMEDVPYNSHFRFDGLLSMRTSYNWRDEIFDWWGYVDFYTYFTLNPQANINDLQAKTPDFVTKYVGDWKGFDMAFEPLSDAYLNSPAKRQPGPVGSMSNIYIFVSIAAFILLIACINFMNLSTARSVERAKEVGIRKAIGSRRKALVIQFLVESVFLVLLGATLAIILTSLSLPYLEKLTGKVFSVAWLFSFESTLLIFLIILTLGLLSGLYPAWILSRFEAIKVLKGSFKTSSHGNILRKSLVVVQFTLSIILLVGTMVIASQLDFLRNHDRGYTSERMLILNFDWDAKVQKSISYIKGALLNHPDVIAVSASRAIPGDFFPNAGTVIEDVSGEMVSKGPAIYEIDEDFIPSYEMEMVAGRNYSRNFPTDSTQSLIVNEAAIKLWGYSNPEDIVGKKFTQWGREGKVIGVVKNFNYVSLHKEVEPLTLRYGMWHSVSKISLRLSSENIGKTLAELEELWATLAPHRPFLTSFVDDSFNRQYEEDERFGQVFTVFSGLAIFIACLGLFGLTIYSTAQRTKEIGIRKVLGASVLSIVSLMSLDFLKLYFLALVVAIPVSLHLMKEWLADFAYSIQISWYLFASAAAVTLFISLFTMATRTLKAAKANPVDSLRTE